jgi:hypothetical protein
MYNFRRLAIATLLLCSPCIVEASKNPWVWPQSIAVNFKHGDSAVFEISEDKVTGFSVRVDGTTLTAPADVCSKLQYVQFESVHIIYPVGADTLKSSDWFEVKFRVGPESRRSSCELPEVQLTFRHAKFQGAAVTIRKGDSWLTTDL